MGLVGYPDWERLVRSGGDAVVTFSNHVTANTQLGPFNVQQWQEIMTVCLTQAASDDYQILYSWYDTKTLDNLLSQGFQTINANQLMPLAIPVVGPWLVINLIPDVGGNGTPVVLTVFGMSSAPTTFDINTYSGPLFNDTSSMGANSITTWTLSNIHYGNAIMHFGPDTAAMTYVRIRYFNWSAHALQELYRWPDVSNTNSLTEKISLPAAPIVVDYKNGATVQFITASLMPAPS